MLRIAFIGAGQTVKIGHAPAMQALHDCYRVVAIADQSREALHDTGLQLGVSPEHQYLDYRALLAQEEVDVVSITLPHVFHHDVAMDVLRAGAHVIAERPLSLSVHDAEEVLRLAEWHGKQVTVLHYFLFYPPFRAAIRRIIEGAIGEPFLIRCEGVTGGYGVGTATYHPAWHGEPDIAGGGVWIDSGYHNAYLCVALARSPVRSIAARVNSYHTDLPVDDTALALLNHANGSVSNILVAWSAPSGGQRVLEIYGTEGAIALDHEGYSLGIFSNATQSWYHPEIESAHDQSFRDIYRAIYECLHFGAPAPVSHRDALHTLEIIAAGYRANEADTVELISPWGDSYEGRSAA